jgi:hypothetical protein
MTIVTKKANAAGHKITQILKGVLDAARQGGVVRPGLFVEAEASTIYVMDLDHPGDANPRNSAGERQKAIVARIEIGPDAPFDTGAW